MHLLNARQRVAAASLLKRRPELLPGAGVSLDDQAYNLWYELVCSEMHRLGIIEPGQVREFCDRAGVPTEEVVSLSVAPPTAA